jgi:beta-xylosidase
MHGFPLDWNHWQIDDWPSKLDESQAVTDLPIWVTEIGVSMFGADEVQVFVLQRTTQLLLGRVPRIFWFSLLDLPPGLGNNDPAGSGRAKAAPTTAIFTMD